MPDTIPDHLMKTAYRAGKEFAWPRADAIAVVNHLAQHGKAVLGTEIWLPSSNGPIIPTPSLYHWTAPNSDSGDSPAEFVERARAGCVQFIVDFDWGPVDDPYRWKVPYFNLTFAESP